MESVLNVFSQLLSIIKKPETENSWYKVCKSENLTDKPLAKNINGIPIVLFRGKDQKVGALLDRCPHRNIPMSNGWVENDNLVCRFHGWHFDTEGVCTKVAQMKVLDQDYSRNAVSFTPVEKDGFIYVYCNNTAEQFPQIKQKPAEIKYKVPQLNDKKFLPFIINMMILLVILLILTLTWIQFVPYFLLK